MFFILPEDAVKVFEVANHVIDALGKGAKRIDEDVNLGDNFAAITVSGYWVEDLMRIDIKVKK